MAPLAHPQSGLAHGWTSIPQWQKGSKVSLSSDSDSSSNSDNAWDSESDVDSDSSESNEARRARAGRGADDDAGSTPKARRKRLHGRKDGSKTAPHPASAADSPAPSSSTPHAQSTIRRRPRAPSSSFMPAPGSAAQAMAIFTYQANSSFSAATATSISAPPLPSGFAASAAANNINRRLDRACTAPTNLFGGALPASLSSSSGDDDAVADQQLRLSQAAVNDAVTKAMERNDGFVGLDGISLVRLPPNIGELAHLVSHDVRTGISAPMKISLFLANNYLTAAGLSKELFLVNNLTILSLRGNQLEEIPAGIGKLVNLKSLNVAMNKLQYLPAEILDIKIENLYTSPNPFLKYVPQSTEPQSTESQPEEPKRKHLCEPRKIRFKVPSLLELTTRVLLEPIEQTEGKAFSPSSAPINMRRRFHEFKDEMTSPRTDFIPMPPHLLKPFLPLLQPLPYHLRHLYEHDTQRTIANDVLKCSVCKTAVGNFAEERLEWRHEIGGQKIAGEADPSHWIPIKWRGCTSQCLDFLDDLA